MLRYLVSQYLRETARTKIQQAAEDALRRQSEAGALASTPGEPAAAPPTTSDVLVLFALGAEAGGLVDRLESPLTFRGEGLTEHVGQLAGRQVSVAVGGVGRAAAARACRHLIRFRRPAWVISAGFAGSLQEHVGRGHFLLADGVADTAGKALAIGTQVDAGEQAARRNLHVGRLLTVDRLIRESDEKRQLGQQHAALACDMETFAVAEVCGDERVRLISVRIVSDAVDESLPRDVEKLLQQPSTLARLGAAAGVLWRRPGGIKDLWKLKEDALQFSDRLALFVEGMVRQLPEAERRPTEAEGETP